MSAIERSELLVVRFDDAPEVIRVWENTSQARQALREWLKQDASTDSPDDWVTVEDWMDNHGIRSYTTEQTTIEYLADHDEPY